MSVLPAFLDPSWVHLGDAPDEERREKSIGYYLGELARDPSYFLRRAYRLVTTEKVRHNPTSEPPERLYERTNFREYVYRVGVPLPVPDNSIGYVFSEHFLHHLFLDEVGALLREVYRCMKSGGVVRTVVPDADLRTYLPPEPAGFPDLRMSFDHPYKHKTRFSVYSLSEALRYAGFAPVALRYCDRHGVYHQRDPEELPDRYPGCADPSMAFSLDHVFRLDSLVVDGVKP